MGYSASGIYPYLVHDTIASLAERGVLAIDAETGIANYNTAILSGIVSIMSKMGISTMQGYHAAQIFEAVGLASESSMRTSPARSAASVVFRSTICSMNVTCTTLKRSNSARLPRLISFPHQALPPGVPAAKST